MSTCRLIGLISATRQESRLVLGNLKKNRPDVFYTGKIGKNNVVAVLSGVGKTNASHAATILIENFSPSLVVNFGIGGAYPSSGMKTGDVAIADREVYNDEGLWLKNGFSTAESIGIPLLKKGGRKYFNEFPLDKRLIKSALKTIPLNPALLKGRVRISAGTFVTTSTSTGTRKRAVEIEKRLNAVCENMEGAAVAHICAMYGIPMLEMRGISNIVEDRDKKKWDIKAAADNCQAAVLGYLTALIFRYPVLT